MSLTNEDKKWIIETVTEIINATVPYIVERIIDERVPKIIDAMVPRIIDERVPKIIDLAIDNKIKPLINESNWESIKFTKHYVDTELYEVKEIAKKFNVS